MKLSKGFTMIELVVVMSVFLFIIGAAISIFISVVQSQKTVMAKQELLNQISYASEYMSKALRMSKAASANSDAEISCMGQSGYVYLLTRHGTGVYQGVKFLDQVGVNASQPPVCQEFYLNNGVLYEVKDGASPVPLTSSSVKINSIRFAVDGLDGTVSGIGSECYDRLDQCGACNNVVNCGPDLANGQPRLTILLNVQVAGSAQVLPMAIQTTVSQRNLNISN